MRREGMSEPKRNLSFEGLGWRAEKRFGHMEIDSKRVSSGSVFRRVVDLHKREEFVRSRDDRN
jgi:hypothetical protein